MTDDRLAVSREARVVSTFVELADTLVEDFDVVDMLTTLALRAVELLDAAAAGILLADSGGRLRVLASSSDAVELLELFQIQNDEGPCMDCYATGAHVSSADLTAETRWPGFAPACITAGFAGVSAFPMRLRSDVIGSLNLFLSDARLLTDGDARLAQALSDIACIAIFQQRATAGSVMREEQLQHALTSRVIIEQAKGIIVERANVSMEEAFVRLRHHARSNNRALADVARGVVDATVDVNVVIRRQPHGPEGLRGPAT